MKFRLTLSKSIVIDTSEKPKPHSLVENATTYCLGEAWAEQILEALRDDNPEAQIDTSDVDSQTGAIVRCIEDDVAMTIDDFAIDPSDIKVEILPS